MKFGVVACSACRLPWAVELRHGRSACPACKVSVDLAGRTRLWQGDDARQASQAAAQLRAALAGGKVPAPAVRLARHDSPVEAAAAHGRGIPNKSRRAEEVAVALTRLLGHAPHAQLREALEASGLESVRAEREILRMMATDFLTEPVAGRYRVLRA